MQTGRSFSVFTGLSHGHQFNRLNKFNRLRTLRSFASEACEEPSKKRHYVFNELSHRYSGGVLARTPQDGLIVFTDVFDTKHEAEEAIHTIRNVQGSSAIYLGEFGPDELRDRRYNNGGLYTM